MPEPTRLRQCSKCGAIENFNSAPRSNIGYGFINTWVDVECKECGHRGEIDRQVINFPKGPQVSAIPVPETEYEKF